jgi:perosamine synthetase
VARRRALAAEYRRLLAEIPRVEAPEEPEWALSNWQSYCVRLPPCTNQIGVMQHMLDHEVATRRGVMCVHLERAYENLPLRSLLPESERARNESILLPLFPQMTAEIQLQVVEALRQALRQ